MPKPQPKREVEVVRPAYQPSKSELNEDVRVDATFEEAVDALTKPVNMQIPAALDRDSDDT